MLRNVFSKTLWDQRRALVAWAIGIAAIGILYAAFYPTVNTPDMTKAFESYPKSIMDAMGFTDIASAAGYLGATTFGLLGPALVIVMAAWLGGGAIAGDEDAGKLDLLLAYPVSRASFVVQRFAALAVAMLLACSVLGIALVAMMGIAQLESIGAFNLLATSFQLALLGIFFGGLALAAGAATGRRGLVYGLVAAVAVVGYFGNNVGPMVAGLGWLVDVSPFHYYSGGAPLRNGLPLADAAVLVVATVVLVLAGTWRFERRDVAV